MICCRFDKSEEILQRGLTFWQDQKVMTWPGTDKVIDESKSSILKVSRSFMGSLFGITCFCRTGCILIHVCKLIWYFCYIFRLITVRNICIFWHHQTNVHTHTHTHTHIHTDACTHTRTLIYLACFLSEWLR